MWLPDPQYEDASKEHYKALDRPSGKSNVDDKSKHLMKKERVRDAIECVACKKWRTIFAATKPTAVQTEQLSEMTDALQYSGWARLLPEDHVSCDDPVDKLYYLCRKFEDICCWCGALGPEARIDDETRAIYKVVNPVCQECAAAGKRPVESCKKSQMADSRNE